MFSKEKIIEARKEVESVVNQDAIINLKAKLGQISNWYDLVYLKDIASFLCNAYVDDPSCWTWRMRIEKFFNGHVRAAEPNNGAARLRFLKHLLTLSPLISSQEATIQERCATYQAKQVFKEEFYKNHPQSFFSAQLVWRGLAGIGFLATAVFLVALVVTLPPLAVAITSALITGSLLLGIITCGYAGYKLLASTQNIRLDDTDFAKHYQRAYGGDLKTIQSNLYKVAPKSAEAKRPEVSSPTVSSDSDAAVTKQPGPPTPRST